jgi:hypothetical protein
MRRITLSITLSIIALLALIAVSCSVATAANGAQMNGNTVPSTVVKDGTYTVSVTMKNTGTTIWKANTMQFYFGSYKTITLPQAVAPGKSYEFKFPLKLSTLGAQTFKCGMKSAGTAFGTASDIKVTVVDPLAVVDSAPRDDAFDQPIYDSIYVFFNRVPATSEIISFKLKDNNGVNVPGTLSFSGDSVIFKPSSLLTQNLPYKGTLTYLTGKPGDAAKTYLVRFKTAEMAPYDAWYVSDTIPATITHDKAYQVSVKFKNTGTSTWTPAAGCKLKYSNTYFPLTGSVPTWGTATFTFSISVHTPGTYNVPIQMSKSGTGFGGIKMKQIKVT